MVRAHAEQCSVEAVKYGIMPDEIAVYCRNGHYMGTMPDDHYRGLFPGRLRQTMEEQFIEEVERLNFCKRCGAESVVACLHCETVILSEMPRPDFCDKCGRPFPWAEESLSDTQKDNDEFGPLER